jgi:hypothetical protein
VPRGLEAGRSCAGGAARLRAVALIGVGKPVRVQHRRGSVTSASWKSDPLLITDRDRDPRS